MTNPGRPLSPHLSIYRWPVTMALSILHRLTGLALSAGLLMFAWWLSAAAGEPAAWQRFADLAGSWPGRLLFIGWSAAFFFHIANGIRHLAWDLGYGFGLRTANASAWAVLVLTILLTAAYWVLT